MQTFTQNKIALAVGTALLVMAGAANAVIDTPLAGATKTSLASLSALGTAATPTQLYATAGISGKSVRVSYLANAAQLVPTPTINTGAPASATQGNAADDVSIFYLGVASAPTIIPPGELSVIAVDTAGIGSGFNITVDVTPVAPSAVRINNATGALEYSTNNTVAAPVWYPVLMSLQVVTATPITDGGAAITVATPATGVFAASDIVLAPTSKTFAAAAASKISGLTVDFKHPVTAPTTTELDILSRVPTPLAGSTSLVKTAGSITAATGTAVTITAVTGSTTAYDVKVGDMTKPDWDNTDAAGGALDIAAAASSIDFNTGVNGASVPMELAFKTGKAIAFTNIFAKTTGVAATTGIAGTGTVIFTATGTTSTDGAAPVLVSAVTDTAGQPAGTSKLSLTFSERVAFIEGAGLTADVGGKDLRETAENVKLGADTLAALNLNAGGTLAVAASAPTTTNLGVLDITGIRTADLTGKTVTVGQGISVKESNDASYVAATPALDNGATALSGGVTTAASEFLSSAATATTGAALTIAFNSTDTSATAATTLADPTKVGSVIVKFVAGKEVALNAAAPAKTLADLAADLVVTVNGLAGQTPVQWQFHPVAADLTLSTAGDTLTIALPTALLYSKMNVTTTMKVGYLNTAQLNVPVANVLVSKANAAVNVSSVMANAFDGEPVVLPLSATATANTLLTQSIQGTLTGASNGSLVHAHLAKWEDAPAVTVGTVNITGGTISRPTDGLANKLAVLFAGEVTTNDTNAAANSGTASAAGSLATMDQKVALQNAIAARLNAAAAAAPAVPGVSAAAAAVPVKPITVYATYVGSNALGALASRVYLSMDRVVAEQLATTSGRGLNTDSPIYELSLDPKTGVLSGALSGNLAITTTAATANRGFSVIAMDVAQGLVGATGKFDLLVGVEPDTADIAKGAKALAKLFVILVHEDQLNARKYTQLTSANPGAANFVPFDPNLVNLKGTRTVLGVAPGIAAPIAGTTAAVNIDLAKYQVDNVLATTKWALYSMVNPAIATGTAAAGASFPRSFVGLNTANGAPVSLWTNEVGGDADSTDMAFTMAGNKASVATELGTNGDTLSTFSNTSVVPGAAAIAWKNGVAPTANTRSITFAQAAALVAKAPVGWSLVSVPTGGLTAATADAVIRVGNQAASQFTWIKATDGAMPTLTAGEPVFVFSKAGGNL